MTGPDRQAPHEPGRDTMYLAFQHAFNSICITDADFSDGGPHITAVNPAFCAMTGYTEQELVGRSPRMLQGPDTDPTVLERLRKALVAGEYFFGSTVNYRKNGSPYNVEWNISPLREGGEIVGYVSVQQDISARVAAAREQALFTLVGHLMPTPLLITDASHAMTFANHAMEALLGYSAEELIGASPAMIIADAGEPDTQREIAQRLNRGEDVQQRITLRRKDGDTVHVEHHGVPLRVDHDQLTHHVHTFMDVTDLVSESTRWRAMANLDPLTGVLNRRGANSALSASLQRVAEDGQALALMLLDLDHFKQVNDRFGHPAGDAVLAKVARLLQELVRSGDRVARFGGEEFVVLVHGISTTSAITLANRLRERLAAVAHGDVGQVTASIGLAMARPDDTAASLIARADAALYRAKSGGRNRVEAAEPV